MRIDDFTKKQEFKMLTARQAADALSISPRKLCEMTKQNEIPHVRLGKCVRYPLVDLRRWINDQCQGGES